MRCLQACISKCITVTALLSMVKMPLKGEVGGLVLNSHGNYTVDHGKSWKNHGIVFLNFCGNPVSLTKMTKLFYFTRDSRHIFLILKYTMID